MGNYNAERYINNYFENWEKLNFSDIIIHFFVNDTEVIEPAKVNFFTNNFSFFHYYHSECSKE